MLKIWSFVAHILPPIFAAPFSAAEQWTHSLTSEAGLVWPFRRDSPLSCHQFGWVPADDPTPPILPPLPPLPPTELVATVTCAAPPPTTPSSPYLQNRDSTVTTQGANQLPACRPTVSLPLPLLPLIPLSPLPIVLVALLFRVHRGGSPVSFIAKKDSAALPHRTPPSWLALGAGGASGCWGQAGTGPAHTAPWRPSRAATRS